LWEGKDNKDGTSGRRLYHHYKFGHGRDVIKDYFKRKTLIVNGRVRPE